MPIFTPTIILRHRRENLKKCSLRGLERFPSIQFYTYPRDSLPPLTNYILLTLDAPPLTAEDKNNGLFLVDGTWRYAETMLKQTATENLIKRSLPSLCKTAYPRKQTACADPERGLASIEALYLAYLITGRQADDLLDNYHWKKEFLEINSTLIKELQQ